MHMKMASRMGLNMGCLLIIMVAMLKGATAEFYVVGDSLGWTIPPNISFYSDWADSKTFQIGDQLLFNWTGDHNVAEPSTLAEYENCTKPGIVFGSGFIANLTANGSRFFLSTVDDQCDSGMNMIVTVGDPTTNSSISAPPPSNGSPSASSLTFTAALLAALSLVVVSLFNYV